MVRTNEAIAKQHKRTREDNFSMGGFTVQFKELQKECNHAV
ncbi:hypothetical protein AVDCRST_MAG81-403 [uncultured Synechococcales cyanobacterium]|uniref:Uncharacterized protein n=1 Tax=uncultured Synechococcales cyanobacterium TaxID=1936017 RepID=A0A6J4UQW4_9CYAN|nr:hypothetical protein AVDCRST_MAG81-403 [uncultured Synechococcales cyanobacterium]